MSHIVIQQDSNGDTHYHRFDDVQDAVAHLERLHGSGGTDEVHLYRLTEVEFEVKSYIKVELGGRGAEPREEVTRIPAGEPEIMPTAENLDAVEYVDAVGPIETLETSSVPGYAVAPEGISDVVSDEPRRGLFGR